MIFSYVDYSCIQESGRLHGEPGGSVDGSTVQPSSGDDALRHASSPSAHTSSTQTDHQTPWSVERRGCRRPNGRRRMSAPVPIETMELSDRRVESRRIGFRKNSQKRCVTTTTQLLLFLPIVRPPMLQHKATYSVCPSVCRVVYCGQMVHRPVPVVCLEVE